MADSSKSKAATKLVATKSVSAASKAYPDDLVDITDIPKGTVLRDWFDEGVRIIILRSNFSMNVYLGVPNAHPLAGLDYDSIPLDCHGGLTFAAKGDGEYLPEGYYWYGYDYSHLGDWCWYDTPGGSFSSETDQKWSLKEIVDDAWLTIYRFKKLTSLAERITKVKGIEV